MNKRARWYCLIALIAGLTAVATVRAALENSDCFACHGDKDLVRTNAAQQVQSLFVDAKVFASSTHGTNLCTSCHSSIKDVPHAEKLPPVQCGSCHEAVGQEYTASIHGVSRAMGASGAANCKECHGHHDILTVKHPASPVFKLNLPSTCARCHSNPNLTSEYRMKFPEAAAQYMESIHGRALMKLGLILALAHGQRVSDIAAGRQLRCDSVRRQLSHLYRRTGVRDQQALVAWGIDQGLLRPHDLVQQLR